jgi:TnsA-like endonuclease N terminal
MNTRAQSTPQPIELSLPQRRRADLFRWWSPKAGRMLSAASYLEFRHLLWREIDSTVLALCERPVQIDTYVEGEHLKYMFDAWIRFRNGEERFIEVKPEAALIDGAPRRWHQIRRWCEAQGLTCDWVTDKILAQHQMLLDNWEQALPYVSLATRNPDPVLRDALRELFAQQPHLTVSSIPGFLLSHDPDRVVAEVFSLLYDGEVQADLTAQRVSRALIVHAKRDGAT